MKVRIFSLLLALTFPLILGSCVSKNFSETGRLPAAEDTDRLSIVFPEELEDFKVLQRLLHSAQSWRYRAVILFKDLPEDTKTGKSPLTSLQIRNILETARAYIPIRQKLENFAKKYWTPIEQYQQLSYMPFAFNLVSDPQLENGKELRIDPSIEPGEKQMIQLAMALSVKLTMMDCDIAGLFPYFLEDRLRHTISREDAKAKSLMNTIGINVTSYTERANLRKAMDLILQDYLYRHSRDAVLRTNSILHYTDTVALSSIYFKEEGTNIKAYKILERNLKDHFYHFQRKITFVLSYLFGNAIGFINLRKGKLLYLSEEFIQNYEVGLQPLDIFLEKSPFRLTDLFIPGYYGHVAVWIGSEKQLRELGLWSHPLVRPYQEQIRQGRSIIQAERSGVEIATFKDFLDADDLLHIRAKELSLREKKKYLLNAFRQIGKRYDFNFDVETDKRIVCSEIVYVIFDKITWPTTNSFDRYTISPDQVASEMLYGKTFYPVKMFTHGKAIDSDEPFYRHAVSVLLSENEEEIEKLFPK